MKKRSANKQTKETSQKKGGNTPTPVKHIDSSDESVEETAQNEDDNTTEEFISSSPKEVAVQSEIQNKLHPIDASKTTVVVKEEQTQSQDHQSPVVNIHIHVSSSNDDTPSPVPKVQPIIHLHFDESNKNPDTEGMSSQERSMERRVPSFLSVSSTGSRDMSLDISDIINNMSENSYTSVDQNRLSLRNVSDVDMSDLSNISDSEISVKRYMRKVTRGKMPVIKLLNVKKQKSRKEHHYPMKKSNKIDKDFTSVIPKLEAKLKNLIRKTLERANTHSYNKIKRRINCAKYKQRVRKYDENNKIVSEKSNECGHFDPGGTVIGDTEEVIVISDSDTPAEKSINEETAEEKKKKKRKRKSNIEPAEPHEDVDCHKNANSNEDVCGKDGEGDARKDKSVKSKERERVRTREEKDRKCNQQSSEEELDWSRKVAFAKACQLQPVLRPKDILVESPIKSKEAQKSNNQPKSSSVENKDKEQLNDSLVSCETPKRLSSYKRLTREVSNVESTPPESTSSPSKRLTRSQVLVSGNGRSEEVFKTKKAQVLKRKKKTSMPLVFSDEETEQNDSQLVENESLDKSPVSPKKAANKSDTPLKSVSDKETAQSDNLVLCETTETCGCELQSTGLTEKEILQQSPVNTRKAQDSRSGCGTSSVSVVSGEETQQNGSLVSCERTSEKEILDKSPVLLKKSHELRSKGANSFASVSTNKKAKECDSRVTRDTPKRPSSYQHPDKERSKLQSSPKKHDSPNKRQASEVSTSENERCEVNCPSVLSSKREECLESVNNKRCMTLFAEGCNFSEILQKFREKHYKDKVKVLFPGRSENNCDIPQDQSCVTNESPVEGENEYPTGGGSVKTVKRKKKKEKGDKLTKENRVDENLNQSPTLEEPGNKFPSVTEQPLQSTNPPEVSESHSETNMDTTCLPVTSPSNTNNNEEHVNSDVSDNQNSDKISDVSESCNNSSRTGDEAISETEDVLQESNSESADCVNEFSTTKKKLRSLPDNKLKKPDLENDIQSSDSGLENLRKELLNQCMAQYSVDIKESEGTDLKLKTKRKRDSDSSNLGRSSPPEKKMKESNESNESSKKSKSSNRKGFSGDDYIPLDATGPTKFAVAPLDKVTPYREHSAKDFKGNMLYGNRVKRFSSPKSLQIYKLKQKASPKSSR